MLCRILLSVYIFKANRTQSASTDNCKKKKNLKGHKICRKISLIYFALYFMDLHLSSEQCSTGCMTSYKSEDILLY